ncbi:MAG TPA: BT4734/BF3469 family protein [Pelobium sp.]|nr:BT4734/BF3469 family protein [Pelobium sp.]
MKKIKASYFKNVRDTKPKDVFLDDWLRDTISPPDSLRDKVLKYRKTKDKRDKAKLPCITPSATFKKVRNLDNIKKKNGFIVIDVDREAKAVNRPSNTAIDMQRVKDLISRHPSTYFCGFSVGEDGIYAIIKINPKKPLIKYFEYLKEMLGKHGVFIDESCKDYTRLRFFSYDPECYYNKKAKTLELPKKPKKKKIKYKEGFSKTNLNKVEAVVQLIESNAIDITSDYSDWVKLAGSLYNEFGEIGRSYFHRISSYNHGYNVQKCDKKFDNCRNMNKLSLSTFFFIADSYGIRY